MSLLTVFVLVMVLIVVLALVISSIRVIPAAKIAVVERLGNRFFSSNSSHPFDSKGKGRKLKEGIHFVRPFIDKVIAFDVKVDRNEFEHTVFSIAPDAGNAASSSIQLAIKIAGAVFWRPSFTRLKEFTNQSKETIRKGLLDEIKGELLVIAGKHTADELITDKEAVDMLINCKLRLQDPPHIRWDLFIEDIEKMIASEKESSLKKKGEDLKSKMDEYHKTNANHFLGSSIMPEYRVEFYQKHSARLRWYLEQNGESENGELEEKYGIVITSVSISSVDFDPETRSAFQKQRQEEGKMKAAQVRHDKLLERALEIRDKSNGGMSWKDACDQANIASGISPQTIVTGQGFGGGAMPIINVQAAAVAVDTVSKDTKEKRKK